MNAQAIEWYFQHLDQQGMALLAENYAWIDERLENVCLQGQDEEQDEEQAEEEEEILWDEVVVPMDISDDEEEEEEHEAVVPMDISDDDDSDDDEYRLEPIRLFPAMDEDEEDEDEVLNVAALLQLPGQPALRRSNTIIYRDDNVMVYNGNPNHSRFFDNDPDADDE